jgi:hypothetical protein
MNFLGAFWSLRWQPLVLAVVVWNGLLLTAAYLNNWSRRLEDPLPLALVGGACVLLAAFSGLVAGSSRFRSFVVSEARRDQYDSRSFVVTALVSSLIGFVMLFLAVGQWL